MLDGDGESPDVADVGCVDELPVCPASSIELLQREERRLLQVYQCPKFV